ncbi:MAG TPA: hypothetical protein VK835_02885 [Bacteroidia bacterium]|jgi:hypothetical protein|nr:hypothetical protein [Bacteroidia bacterium]
MDKKLNRHRWTISDDILTYIIFRFDKEGTRFNKEKAAKAIGTSEASLSARIRNFLAVETDKTQGAHHYAEMTKRVHHKYSEANDENKIASNITKTDVLEFYHKSINK